MQKNTFELLFENPYNRAQYERGSIATLGEIMRNYSLLSVAEMKDRLSAEKISLYEISFGIYYLAMKCLQESDFSKGMSYLHTAADDYLNPFAMVKLALFYHHGAEKLQAGFPNQLIDLSKDESKSFFYINLAFQVAGLEMKNSQDKLLLDRVTTGGLALLDAFHSREVNDSFDSKALMAQQENQYAEALNHYYQMYIS